MQRLEQRRNRREIIAAQHERGLLLKQADRARSLSHAQALAKIIQEIETLL